MKIKNIWICLPACIWLAGCGAGNDSGSFDQGSDSIAPSGYSATIDTNSIDGSNDTAVGISVVGAEVGATYDYKFSAGSSEICGTGDVVQSTFDIGGLNLTGLPAGEVTLTFTLTDANGNLGQETTDFAEKTSLADTAAPEGYAVSFQAETIDASNEASVAFNVVGAEIGTTFNYSLLSALGGAELSGTGEVEQEEFDISALDVSDFPDGDISLQFSLTDAAGNIGISVNDVAVKNTLVILSGTVTYDFVPHQLDQPGLDYDATEQRPVRGATVQILDQAGDVVVSTKTDESGGYLAELESNQIVSVRVRAEIVQEGAASSWDFSVTDNTNENALYVLDSPESGEIGSVDQTRDLHAPSGWGGDSYTGDRIAAPFAILDTIYTTVMRFVEIDPSIRFPSAELRWSINNTDVGDGETVNISEGEIGSTSYFPFVPGSDPDSGHIYIVGDEDVNTDEYDPHVVIHEWGHYFEDRLSRSDSIGGAHGLFDVLDMRVAFGEGWANALSAIVLDDPLYKNASGRRQQSGFVINIDSNAPTEVNGRIFNRDPGWYNEFSIHSLVYDLYDADSSDMETVQLGLEPIYRALTNENYIQQTSLTTIFSFLTQLSLEEPAQSIAISELAASQDINGEGFFGVGETNDAGLDQSIPLYKSVTLNGGAVEVCTDRSFGERNHLNNRAFLQFSLAVDGDYTFNVSQASGLIEANPEIVGWGPVYDEGSRFGRFNQCSAGSTPGSGPSETLSCSLLDGDYVLEVFDVANVDGDDATGGEVCFDVSVTSG